jgi:hypothetical protein
VIWLIIAFAFIGGMCLGMWLEARSTVEKYRAMKAEHDAAMGELTAFFADMPDYTRITQ